MSADSLLPADLPHRWVVMGVSGSGKTTIAQNLARQLGWAFLEGDAFHPPANIAKMAQGIPLTDDDRHGWLLVLREHIRQAAQQETSLMLTCSALKRRYRDLLRQADPKLAFLHLEGARELLAQRMRHRSGHFMPADLLDSQLRDLEPLQDDEIGFSVDISDPPAALVASVLQHFRTGVTTPELPSKKR